MATDGRSRDSVPADPAKLVHDNTYGARPSFYLDRPFTCIDCGANEVWTASQQKWWYEEAKGKIASAANRCRDCRRKRRMRRSQERRLHVEGLIARYGIEGAAEKLQLDIGTLIDMRARWLEP
ncbi:MAG: zinc-ribbon domain containing protein [Hyphomicrobiaceae bacterium]